jgi:hypothetical protein
LIGGIKLQQANYGSDQMDLKPQGTELDKQESGKRPYQTPQLFVYGSIREITRNVGAKGTDDGGGGAAAGPKTGA